MLRYIARRVLWLGLVLLIVALITYMIFFVMPPTDPTVNFCGRRPTSGCIEELSAQFGLDKPIYIQYAMFVKHIFLGDQYGWPGLGFSFKTRGPLKPILFDRMGITLQLALGGAIVWMLVGVPIGIISARRRGTMVDRVSMGFALFAVSAPVFWLGLMFLFVFWFKLKIASGTGYSPIGDGLFTWLNHMIMPWTVLALSYAAFYARMVRADLTETMEEDYIRTARAKGLSERRVVMRHGLRSALTPAVTLFGINLGGLLGGALITETVFNLQGLGWFTVQATRDADLYAVLDITILGAFFVAIANLFVDIAYAFLDPRVRYS